MAKAKLTINRTQAQAIGLLVCNTKSKFPILYDSKSGVNLQETKSGKYITVKDGADISNLLRFQKLKYFSVVEGSILPAPELESIAVSEDDANVLILTFTENIKCKGLVLGADFILSVDGTELEDLEVDRTTIYSNILEIDTGIELTDKDISFEITTNGAAGLYNKYNACLAPGTKTIVVE